MKKYIFFYLLLFTAFTVWAQREESQKFYVGTFTSEGAEGIYLCDFNPVTGEIILEKTFKGIEDPSFLRISPNQKYLYVVTRVDEAVEKSGGYVSAYQVEKNGNIHFLNKQASNGDGPCHVDVSSDGRFVAIAAYSGGTTSLYPANVDGTLKPATSVIVNRGSGPVKNRQGQPHAHSIKFSPFSSQVFSADLGTDQLNIFELEGDKLIQSEQKFVKLAPGAGPRHFEFHPNGKVIYVISELNSTVTALRKEEGKWENFQVLSTLPKDFKGTSYCADIHITKDGRYLYGSNRGDNSVAVFAVDLATQKLTFKTTVDVQGNWPRNFSLTPDENFMLVANQRSGNITVFKMNKETGVPEFTGKEIELPSPVCIDFLKSN